MTSEGEAEREEEGRGRCGQRIGQKGEREKREGKECEERGEDRREQTDRQTGKEAE